jgi:hypothetical protein
MPSVEGQSPFLVLDALVEVALADRALAEEVEHGWFGVDFCGCRVTDGRRNVERAGIVRRQAQSGQTDVGEQDCSAVAGLM